MIMHYRNCAAKKSLRVTVLLFVPLMLLSLRLGMCGMKLELCGTSTRMISSVVCIENNTHYSMHASYKYILKNI